MGSRDVLENRKYDAAITPEERETCLAFIQSRYPEIDPDTVELQADDSKIYFKLHVPKRTLAKMGGTYIGDPETWNDAKRAEYYDTVPNSLDDII